MPEIKSGLLIPFPYYAIVVASITENSVIAQIFIRIKRCKFFSVGDLGCLYRIRIRIFPSRIRGQRI
jgi:hypothetical protein